MKNSKNKSHMIGLFIGFALFSLSTTTFAQNKCSSAYHLTTDQINAAGVVPVTNFSFNQKRFFAAKDLNVMVEIAEKYDSEIMSSLRKTVQGRERLTGTLANEKVLEKIIFVDVVDAVARSVQLRNLDTSGKVDQLKAAEEMAKFAMELEPSISLLSKPDQKFVKFTLGKTIGDIEAFRPDEYVTSENLFMQRTPERTYLHFTEYKDMVKSYIDNTSLYNDIPQADINGFRDIRDMLTHNRFPISLKPHDMFHIHFGLGHPLGLASVMTTSRSKNNIRALIMGGVFEGVDRTQYDWEAHLNRYFDKKRNMTLEEALIHVATASHAELTKIMQESGTSSNIASESGKYRDYVPWKSPDYGPGGKTGRGFKREMITMIEDFLELQQDPQMAKYLKFDNMRVIGGVPENNERPHY